ncbi:MAG: ABC transporter ATP-binding protein [Verrucomicrobiota bacterium]|nr:ABC transporter ATP-binding protein [Verrucomicrobiota bacterium]
MSDDVIISVERLSKRYRLGVIGATTLRESAERWWHRLRGRDPAEEMGQIGNAGRKPDRIEHQGRKERGVQETGAPEAAPRGTWRSLRSSVQDSSSDGIWALKDVSFKVKRGEVLGIIGRNGAGKSTLLKILSRITEPTSGRAVLRGRVGSLLEVGTGFHPELSGRENIFLNGAILGMKRKEIAAKFDEIVAFAEIEKFIDTPVKRYSSGMYVRLAFAVAAHLDPEILLVDEVLAVGDAAFQKKCLGKMESVAGEGRTVLFVSHNMTAVRGLCRRVLCLDAGIVAEDGEASTTIENYLRATVGPPAARSWDDIEAAPGNDRIRVLSAGISPVTGSASSIINVDTPFDILFVVWNRRPESVLNLTAHFRTSEGVHAFATGCVPKARDVGEVRERLRIPAGLLNDSTYRVSLQVVEDGAATLYQYPDILTFHVAEGHRRGFWHGKYPGVVRPRLEWCTERGAGLE